MQAIPDPQAHIFSDKQSFIGKSLIIHIGGNVDKTCQLLMDRVIWSPHPIIIIITAIHLNKSRMVSRDSIEIAITILLILFFMLIKRRPTTFHLAELLLGSKIASLPITTQLLIPHKSTLLTLTKLIHHTSDITAQSIFILLRGSTRKGKSQSRHIVSRTMTFEFGGRRVPTIGWGITFGRKTVCITIVV